MTAFAVAGHGRTPDEIAHLIDPARPLTSEQATIVGADTAPMLVVAGAGSGKTETLSLRMAYLVDNAARLFGTDISPDEILCLTFTRKAAAEIADRAAVRMDAVFGADPGRPLPTVATYNAFAGSLTSEHGLRMGVDPDSMVLTDAALWQLASSVVDSWTGDLRTDAAVSTLVAAVPRLAAQARDHDVAAAALRGWCLETLAAIESLPRRTGDDVPGTLPGDLRRYAGKLRSLVALADLIEEYDRRKRAGSTIDFSDQVQLAGVLAALPVVQAIERSRYRAVLLDEFQDSSMAQIDLFERLFGTSHSVMAVGDPNQAIYGFRGASANALAEFVRRYGAHRVARQTLSVSWRNEAAVLDVANAAAAELRAAAPVHVEPLRSRSAALGVPEPERAREGVSAAIADDLDSEADAIASFILSRRAELGPHATAAVLCRRRVQFGPIVDALVREGVAVEVAGLGGLLDTPEVADVVALLEVAHDPSRGDSLMRLLTSERVSLGASDLAALHAWAEHEAGPRESREVEPSIVDALADLPPHGWVSRDGNALTDIAYARLEGLRAVVDTIRRHAYLPVAELILFAERAYGLDIESAVARASANAGQHMDTFIDAARSFSRGLSRPTLGAFLAWLDAARIHEDGLDLPGADAQPGVVQVLTVHAAKGLEWDIVSIPGLQDGDFPKVSVPSASTPFYSDTGWLGHTGALPWELRSDRADLPQWQWRGARDHAELASSVTDFREAAGRHAIAEERRLFYVALTRARTYVHLSAAAVTTRKTPTTPSSFVSALVESGVIDGMQWVIPDSPATVPPPVGRVEEWPRPASAAQVTRRELAREVREALADGDGTWNDDLPLARELRAIVAERVERGRASRELSVPIHLSASDLVSMTRDRDAFALNLRRPLPTEPTRASARGSAMHAWIEAYFGHGSMLEPGVTIDEPEEAEASDLTSLRAAFQASTWAERTPIAVEVDVDFPVGPVTIRCRIDAVFPPGRGLKHVTIVDWKSGAPPRDAADRAAREVQLATYRLAWAIWKGIDVSQVDAAFHYVAHNVTVWPDRTLDRAQIEDLVMGTGSAGPV